MFTEADTLDNMASQAVGPGFRTVMRLLRNVYSTVPRINTDQMEKLMADKDSSRPLVILDTREPEEIQVSRLPNSIPVNPNLKDMSELLSIINKAKGGPEQHATVIMSCAIGYRASIMTKKLMQELSKPEHMEVRKKINVWNLEGALFKWANEGRHMIDGIEGNKTHKVHGVNRLKQKMLFPELVSK